MFLCGFEFLIVSCVQDNKSEKKTKTDKKQYNLYIKTFFNIHMFSPIQKRG